MRNNKYTIINLVASKSQTNTFIAVYRGFAFSKLLRYYIEKFGETFA